MLLSQFALCFTYSSILKYLYYHLVTTILNGNFKKDEGRKLIIFFTFPGAAAPVCCLFQTCRVEKNNGYCQARLVIGQEGNLHQCSGSTQHPVMEQESSVLHIPFPLCFEPPVRSPKKSFPGSCPLFRTMQGFCCQGTGHRKEACHLWAQIGSELTWGRNRKMHKFTVALSIFHPNVCPSERHCL